MERLDTTCCFAGSSVWQSRSGLGRDGVFEEPGPPARRHDRGEISGRRSGAAARYEAQSNEHFSVDGTLIEAWASMKSFKPKDGSGDQPPSRSGRNVEVDFKGRKRSNETHASTTDRDARLYRKGAGMEAKLAFLGHALTGEPLLPDRQRLPYSGRRPGRAHGGVGDDRTSGRSPDRRHAGRRQGL